MNKIQKLIEENVFYLIVLVLLVISVAMMVEILPLAFQKSVTTSTLKGVVKYTPEQLAGREIYLREGCYNCHSQMIRPFRAETERYGHYSLATESVYDHPFQWGSKRTGPDLARVGGRYSNEWHKTHLINPRDVVPESNMPAFAFLAKSPASVPTTLNAMAAMNKMPMGRTDYTEEDFANVAKDLEGKTEMDVLITYLQGLGLALKGTR
jgi:cytochrome c oxidase cbb3-type subunit 2